MVATTKKLRITVEGRTFDVTVEILDEHPQDGTHADLHDTHSPLAALPHPPAAAAAPPPRAAPAAGGAAAPGAVPSPLAGTIVSVEVSAGQAVKNGDVLVVLEAMKMKTSVRAPRAGTVSRVAVEAGATVEEGSTLVVLG